MDRCRQKNRKGCSKILIEMSFGCKNTGTFLCILTMQKTSKSVEKITIHPSALLVPGYTGTDAANYMGAPEDFEGLELEGKIVLVARGSLSFFEKHINSVAGARMAIPRAWATSTAIPDCSSTAVRSRASAAFVRTTGVDNEVIKADAGSRWAPCREEMSHRAGCGERVCSSAHTFC